MKADGAPHSGRESFQAELEQRISGIIRREFPGGLTEELAATTPILGKGLGLDSVEGLVLITAIEAEFGIVVDDDELSLTLFTNLRTLADHVAQKLRRDGAPARTVSPHGTLPDLLETVARQHAGRVAIVEAERQLTYGQLREGVAALADRLGDLGVARGAPIALLLPNGAEFVISFFAVARRGGLVLPLNSRYQETELTYALDEATPSLLITVPPLEALCRRVAASAGRRCDLLVLDDVGAGTSGTPEPPRAPSADRHRPPPIQPDDPVLCQYSSGSTGFPKRVVRTHANLLFELSRLGEALRLGADDRFLGVVPFSHVNGLVRSMLAALSVGATLVPLPEFKRHAVISTIERERITVVIAVPFVFSILADTVSRTPIDFSSLRLCVSASAPLPVATSRRFHERCGTFVRQLYGSTETGTISVHTGADVEDSLDSVGVPLEGVEVRILRDDASVADVDEPGEVAVKSPAAITGYPGGDGESFRGGYFLTGDVGRIDRRGYLYLVGRRKYFINRGGYKINPWELETLLQTHPKVEEAAVIGVPTRYGDEVVKAVIVSREICSVDEIIEYCRGKVADFKIPSVVEFRPRLPHGPTGKVLRRELA